jgi:hypothetical protein
MNGEWVIDRDYEKVAAAIAAFQCKGMELEILVLRRGHRAVVYGCYVPALPRPTSIATGKIHVQALAERTTWVRLEGFPKWASPFTQALIDHLYSPGGWANS